MLFDEEPVELEEANDECGATFGGGGTGSRLGGQVPKQYLEVNGKPIIAYCMGTLLSREALDALWVVAEKEWHGLVRKWSAGHEVPVFFSEPGRTRQLSVWNGLQGIKEWLDSAGAEAGTKKGMDVQGAEEAEQVTVLIHDAARPLVSARLIADCLAGCREHDGVMPALPVKDTMYYGQDGKIESLLERSKVITGQAPEAFRFAKYYEANQRLLPDEILKINGSTEVAILAGMDVEYIVGEERNFKITTMADLRSMWRCRFGICWSCRMR